MIEILALIIIFLTCIALGVFFLLYVKRTNEQIIMLTKALKANDISDMQLIDKEPSSQESGDKIPEFVSSENMSDEEFDDSIKNILARDEE